MSRLAVFAMLCLYAGYTNAMECTLSIGANYLERAIEKTLYSCPGLLDSSDKSYCCYSLPDERFYCCDSQEFFIKTGLGIVVPVVITISIIFVILVSCLCCFCCRCCPIYRRRHAGSIYGKVQAPNTVVHHVIQAPADFPPSYNSQAAQAQNHYIPYPTNAAGLSQQPPPYSNEMYTKQAPYNPSYQPQ